MGPDRLKDISKLTHDKAKIFNYGLLDMGIDIDYQDYFDTICLNLTDTDKVYNKLKDKGIYSRKDHDKLIFSFDETIRDSTCLDILNTISESLNKGKIFDKKSIEFYNNQPSNIDNNLLRTTNFLESEIFNKYHTETEFTRYVYNLTKKDYTLCEGMIPLGSCTMKLNSVSELEPLTWESVVNHHPYIPLDNVKGYLQLFDELSEDLKDITGFNNVSYQSNSGSMGEYSGLLCIRKYHEKNKDNRYICLIPDSAHGTIF